MTEQKLSRNVRSVRSLPHSIIIIIFIIMNLRTRHIQMSEKKEVEKKLCCEKYFSTKFVRHDAVAICDSVFAIGFRFGRLLSIEIQIRRILLQFWRSFRSRFFRLCVRVCAKKSTHDLSETAAEFAISSIRVSILHEPHTFFFFFFFFVALFVRFNAIVLHLCKAQLKDEKQEAKQKKKRPKKTHTQHTMPKEPNKY